MSRLSGEVMVQKCINHLVSSTSYSDQLVAVPVMSIGVLMPGVNYRVPINGMGERQDLSPDKDEIKRKAENEKESWHARSQVT